MNVGRRAIESVGGLYGLLRGWCWRARDAWFERRYRRPLFSDQELAPVVQQNRNTLAQVPCWIRPADYEGSLFHYGLPPSVRHLIDRPISDDITYSDVLGGLAARIGAARINYLELGVSVGKNFLQIARLLRESELTGFEIEEINPLLEARFADKEVCQRWPTLPASLKKQDSSLTTYRLDTNRITYLCGDVFDEQSWTRLRGRKFNLIFSDAFHSPAALLREYEMLQKYELFDERGFAMIWDDLGGPLTPAFLRVARDMRARWKLGPGCTALSRYRGWLGQHESPHLIGVFQRQ